MFSELLLAEICIALLVLNHNTYDFSNCTVIKTY